MRRRFTSFVGVDLGGARGKTTAVAHAALGEDGRLSIGSVSTRHQGEPWVDENLLSFISTLGEDSVVALGAPLTGPACARCVVPACPGVEACVDPAVVWMRTAGRSLLEDTEVAGKAVHGRSTVTRVSPRHRVRVQPYAHRATELLVCYDRGLIPPSALGGSVGLVANRAQHLRRRLLRAGYALNQNLLEVSPTATVAALFDRRRARGYKRDADPWQTRASIIEALDDLEFAPQSRLAREDALRNDHCFDALLAAYTAYLWSRDGWTMPDPPAPFGDDGWIWVPPPR